MTTYVVGLLLWLWPRGVAFTDVVEGLQAALDEAAVHPHQPITSALILCLVSGVLYRRPAQWIAYLVLQL